MRRSHYRAAMRISRILSGNSSDSPDILPYPYRNRRIPIRIYLPTLHNVPFILFLAEYFRYFCYLIQEQKYERSKSERDGPRLCLRDVDAGAHADGDVFPDARCVASGSDFAPERTEVQHADVLVHRPCCKRHQGVLYVAWSATS